MYVCEHISCDDLSMSVNFTGKCSWSRNHQSSKCDSKQVIKIESQKLYLNPVQNITMAFISLRTISRNWVIGNFIRSQS